jgi:hypothetical protein
MHDHTRISVSTTRRAAITLGAKIAAFVALVASGARATAHYHGPPHGGPGGPARPAAPGGKPRPNVRRFARGMSGANEVPAGSGDPVGRGQAVFEIKNGGRTICARFTVHDLSPGSVVQRTHIHQGSAAINGPIKVDFQGKLSKCVPVPRGLSDQIRSRPASFYANLHTNLFPDGAIRAQLRK